jgi:ELWxxDGT repeat protein
MKPLILTLLLQLALAANAGDLDHIYSITGRTEGSHPAGFFFKGRMFVFADDGIHGYQLWECDSANTLHPVSALKNPLSTMMELNDKLFFFCGSPQDKYGLWEFNGIDPPRQLFSRLNFINNNIHQVFSNKIYTYDFGNGLEEFDGTNPPKKVANSSTHFTSQYLPSLTVYKDKLYFISNDNIHGNELWSCDSTGATAMVADLNPGESSSDPRAPAVHKDKLYFWANDGIHGNELWEYDGTNAPVMAGDINSGPSSSMLYYETDLIELNDKLYFSASDGIHSSSLWEYNGSDPPRLIPGTEGSYPKKKFIFRGKLYYYDPSYLYEYDGINNPKRLLYSYDWDKHAIFDDNLFIWVPSGNNREDLFKYDGINPPRNLTASIVSRRDYNDPDFIIVNNRLCFGQFSRLYACAGDSVHLISDNFPSRFNRIGEFNHQYYFQFEDPLYGSELWSMDGIHPPAMLSNLNKTLIVPGGLGLRVQNDKLYFTFSDSIEKYVEYDSIRFKTLSPDFNRHSVYNLLSYNNKFYFNQETGKFSMGLFESNGTEQHEISSSSSLAGLIVYHNAIYYGINTNGLYKYDGVNPPDKISGMDGEYLTYQTVFNDRLLLFTSADSLTFREYDGVNPPKVLGRCLNYDYSSSMSRQFAEMNHKFYFTGYEREHGKEPWIYDGSNPPSILADIVEGSANSEPAYFTAFRNKLYFSADDAVHGREMWVYDGINPPQILMDIEKGPGSSQPQHLTVSNNKLYFEAYTNEFGTELWQYDGINGPSIVSDLYRGPSGSDPNDLVVYKDQLYLSAVTKDDGRQLYRLCESCSNLVISACDSFNFNGTSLYSTGEYYDTIPDYMGRDSIVRLDLTIMKSTALIIDTVACERYVFSGALLTESGVYYSTVPNSAGCDSLITLNLTVHHSTESSLDTLTGGSFESPSGRYVWTESGTYVDTIPNATGCDSLITINLTVSQATHLQGNESETGMTVYPNPTSETLTIDLGKVYPEALITIIGYDGKIIRNEKICNSGKVSLKINEPSGIYTVIVIVENKEVNFKVIKQ